MNNTIFEAVIFDMDGVVIDSRKPIEVFWIELGKKYDIAITEELMNTKIHGCPARQTVSSLFSHLTDEERELILEQCEEFETTMKFVDMSGVKNLLKSLKTHQISTALVTSSKRPKVDKVIQELSLEGLFGVIVTSDMIKKGKPDPACYLLAAEKLDKNPAACVVFEDAVSGVQAATGAGMFTIGVGSEAQEKLLRNAGAKGLIADFDSVKINNHNNSVQFAITNQLSLALSNSQYITR